MSGEDVTLTTEEQREVVTAGDKWRTSVHDEHVGDLFAAVERIIAARMERAARERAAEIVTGMVRAGWHQ